MEPNSNNQQHGEGFFDKNKQFIVLLLMLVVVIGLSISILLSQV